MMHVTVMITTMTIRSTEIRSEIELMEYKIVCHMCFDATLLCMAFQ